jgi:hypothetical protein
MTLGCAKALAAMLGVMGEGVAGGLFEDETRQARVTTAAMAKTGKAILKAFLALPVLTGSCVCFGARDVRFFRDTWLSRS